MLMMMCLMFLYYPRCPTTVAPLADHTVTLLGVDFETYSGVRRCTLTGKTQLSMTAALQAEVDVEVLCLVYPKAMDVKTRKICERGNFSVSDTSILGKRNLECFQEKWNL